MDTMNNINDDLWPIHVMPNARLCLLVSLTLILFLDYRGFYHLVELDLDLEILHLEVDSLHVLTCDVNVNITEAASKPFLHHRDENSLSVID